MLTRSFTQTVLGDTRFPGRWLWWQCSWSLSRGRGKDKKWYQRKWKGDAWNEGNEKIIFKLDHKIQLSDTQKTDCLHDVLCAKSPGLTFLFSDVPLPQEEKPKNILGAMLWYGSYMALTPGMCIVTSCIAKVRFILFVFWEPPVKRWLLYEGPLILPGATQSPSKLTLYWVCHIFPATEKYQERIWCQFFGERPEFQITMTMTFEVFQWTGIDYTTKHI